MKTTVLVFVARYVIVVWATGRLLVRTRHDQPQSSTTNPHQVGTFGVCRLGQGYDLHQLAKLVDHYGDKVVKSATTTAAAT